jgi:hypothetical protein
VKRRSWLPVLLLLAALSVWRLAASRQDGARAARQAFVRHVSQVILTVPGEVVRILEDDERPPRHQRFVIRTRLGQTLLVLHNLDTGPRVPVRAGDRVTVRGEYIWNDEGGLIHKTHGQARDGGRGWIRVDRTGRTHG